MKTEIDYIIEALSQRELARQVGLPHDEARLSFRLNSNIVNSYAEYEQIIGDYYNHHFGLVISPGASLATYEARERAKELIAWAGKRRGIDAKAAYADARDGTNSGMRGILDMIADGLKRESQERYANSIFDRYVTPVDFEEKVRIIQQFIARCPPEVARTIQTDRPERYASNYRELIQAYLDSMEGISTLFRQL